MYSFSKSSPPASPTTSTHSSSFNSVDGTHDSRNEARLTATAKRQKYLKRLCKFRQMDFEYAFWQMIYLFISPQKVYRNFQYRKYTKDQWARDDPAFLVLVGLCILISSIGFSVVLKIHFVGFLKLVLWTVFVDYIGVGLLIATTFWLISNKYMIMAPPRGQDVEWGYAFDVHLNAFFPLLMILHLFQLVFLGPFINAGYFLGLVFGNTLWLIAIMYYIYNTFLGYSAAHPSSTPGLLKYIYNVKLGAGRCADMGWLTYDQQFRLKRARNPSMNWGCVDMELWLLYISQGVTPTQEPQISQMNAGKCFLYNNKGRCGRSACRYLHRCLKCGGAHAALFCNLKTTQNSQNEKRKPYESFRSDFRREKSYKNNVNGFRFKSASSVPGSI
ncbi:Protein unc-50 homolog A,Protein unc-50 homolog B,Protein unc-50,Protein unc-50 homolog [Mytilus edulis]|uniref:Protein unc-50 homolog A,Protein unc-50 homolog B,Protein unc-50,Protein unc-50 homolog n=1 Tax=Mytilus edulis TaxID=6550 RepID=A0A8S3VKC3_MYTED|nr:Protein unc-50 homolog A,Protein unc-50 homolog B,Protein unc-50,Protein unc-50 homolog [Mytilus edulis]